jgi:hypothetical protein
MVILEGQLEISCNACHHINIINEEEVVFEDVDLDDRGNGTEKTHTAQIELDCDGCGKQISTTYEVHEYPENTLLRDELIIDGGSVVSKPEVSFE